MSAPWTTEPQRLIVVGSGPRELWEPALATLAERYELALIDTDYPTWQGRYAPKHRIADITNASMLFKAVGDLRGERAVAAVITWNPQSMVPLSEVARKLRLRFLAPEAVRSAIDNLELRGEVAAHGLPGISWRLVHNEDDATAAGESIGYPVVLRPRERCGPGVWLARNEGDLRESFTVVNEASAKGAVADGGLLVEKYLDGTEINVCSAVCDGDVVPIAAARTVFSGENDLTVAGYESLEWRAEPWAEQAEAIVATLARTLGLDGGVTNTRLRLTEDGPRVVGLDTWLSGELVRVISDSGAELVLVAAAIAFEQESVRTLAGQPG